MNARPMSELLQAWRAGRVRRWHTNPHLARTDDFVDGHSNRVAVIALTLYPEMSRDGIIYALTHDHGEHAVGDMSYMVKAAKPEVAAALQEMEDEKRADLGFGCVEDEREQKIVKLADWLDAWLWMFHHEPHLSAREDWAQQLSGALSLAADVGVSAPVRRLISEITGS